MPLAPKKSPAFTLCSVQDRSALAPLSGGLRNTASIAISDSGELQGAEIREEEHAVYFGNIQFAGSIEPFSGKSGLGLVPYCVVYNGFANSFMESFAHYEDHPGLHGLTALFVENGSAIQVSENRIRILRGYLATVKLAANAKSPQAFDIQQYGGSERLALDSASLLPGGQVGTGNSSKPEDSR